MSRIHRSLERLLHRSGDGGEALRSLEELVGQDFAEQADLRDLFDTTHAPELEAVLDDEQTFRIRPLLVSLAARAAGAEDRAADPELQHAAEMLHLALVVHDVTLGRSGGRRRRVAKRVMRRGADIFGASHLTLRALELARHASQPDILGEVVDTLREFADGHTLTRQLREDAIVPTEDDWIDHADTHTGALYAFCCRAGGRLAQSDPATLSALGRYGRHVGRLWILVDDVAHLSSDDAAAHLVQRARSGRPVLPVAHAALNDPMVAIEWARLVHRPHHVLASSLAERIVASDSLSVAREAMAQESWSAQKALKALPVSPYRTGMERLASHLARVA